MACITVPVLESFKERMMRFPWVNWSEVSREESLKKEIFERYVRTGTISDEEWEFCERIDWHPVDELPPKKEHMEELKRRLKEETPGKRYNSAEEFFNSLK